MNIKVNNKVKGRKGGRFTALEWTPEADALILEIADGDTTVPEIRKRVLALTGDDRSETAIRHRMQYLGAPMRQRGAAVRITNDMRDFVSAKCYEGLSIQEIRESFNGYFGTDYNYTRIWRIALEARADRDRRFNKEHFAEDWLRLQEKFAPDGAICQKHWLWRWRRFDERRSAQGIVFSGEKEEIPQLLTKGQFRKQWTDMQRLFGIKTTS